MDVRDDEQHQRVIYVGISRAELDGIVMSALVNRLGLSEVILRQYGKVTIEQNMEGSPQYHSGYKATFRATIPLDASGSEVPS